MVLALALAVLLAASAAQAPTPTPTPTPTPSPTAEPPAVDWRPSVAVGLPFAGRLVRGVQLPEWGVDFVTWDPVLRTTPNRPWRRWGTGRAVSRLLRVLREYRAANPSAPRVAVGDLSRPRGGPFGRKYGGLGHASHQNGLDVDVWYPRVDGRERRPQRAWQVDEFLAQELLDRFLAAGAEKVFVGPRTPLTGPPGIVQRLPNHDNHLHVRLRG